MGKRTTIHIIRFILLIISALLIAYILLLEKGLNPRINHLLQKNNYFWIFVFLIAIVFIIITYVITAYVVHPCFICPLFDAVNNF